jgi:hypothetical protein
VDLKGAPPLLEAAAAIAILLLAGAAAYAIVARTYQAGAGAELGEAIDAAATGLGALRRTNVVVHHDGITTAGLLEESADDALTLVNASQLEGAATLEISGRAVIPRAKITRVDVPDPADLPEVHRAPAGE